MTPPLAKKAGILKSLAKPIDSNRTFRGKPILGSHKTWRGAVCGIIVAILVSFLQSWLYRFPLIQDISLMNYQKINVLLFGFLISSGAILGDLVSAFFKRRLALKPGAKFIPLDQINYVIGDFVLFSLTPFFKIKISIWIALFFLTFFLHIIINRLGYNLKLHSAKW
jgi:CDP-2,3-bis-(O-geranylgeranyl)-sn-glycerol synthase